MADCIGLVSPGAMGAAVGRTLVQRGVRVVAVLDGRSQATRRRADEAGIEDVPDLGAMVQSSDIVLSIVPPDAALETAGALAAAVTATHTSPTIVDANAVSPATAARIGGLVESAGAHFVDGDIIGGPPAPGRPTSLYLSGPGADAVATALESAELRTISIGDHPTAASALKMCYAAWTKGTSALLLSIRALAQAEGVQEALLDAWRSSQPDLVARSEATPRVAGRAWRWVGEMEEIARSFESVGLPGGSARAAADIYRRLSQYKDVPQPPPLDELLAALLAG